MGCGIPTTALYIVLAAIAAPAVVQLGVPPLAAHLFILYYGILADLTPPVCVAAYAAAGIAGSNPFRTGLTAFRLGAAKATVPFVFAYAPVMLIMVDDFSLGSFLFVTLTCAVGVLVLGIGLTGYAFTPHRRGLPDRPRARRASHGVAQRAAHRHRRRDRCARAAAELAAVKAAEARCDARLKPPLQPRQRTVLAGDAPSGPFGRPG
jgi:hypothetical protein